MATKCEKCGRVNPKTIKTGPFAGSPHELDYCKHCSMDLCDDCMENARCEEHDGHEREDEDDE